MTPTCSHALESFLPCYVVMIGIYGLFFNLFNLWHGSKDILPEHYLRTGLFNTWISAGIYLFLLVGVLASRLAYYAPFLLLNLLILALIIISWIGRTTLNWLVIPSKTVAFILIINWLSVAWTFGRELYCSNWLESTSLDPGSILHALYSLRKFYMILDF